MKKILALTLIFLVLSACSLFRLVENEAQTRTITGTINQVITTCEVDGICAYVVETETGEQITVIWSEGDSPNCWNNPFPINMSVNTFESENTTIEAYGNVVDASTISVCGDESFYITFLEDDMNMDDAQASRQVTGQVVELISDCAFDGNCAYVVETEAGEQITVIWAEGMSPICQNDPFQGGDTDIAVGDSIDSLGRVIDETTISACGDTAYYIRKTG